MIKKLLRKWRYEQILSSNSAPEDTDGNSYAFVIWFLIIISILTIASNF